MRMTAVNVETHSIEGQKDIVEVRKRIVAIAASLNMNAMKETELRTAATELLTNIARHAGRGTVTIEEIFDAGRRGLHMVFQDEGPGIADMDKALRKGFSTAKSLGHGLSGCKNLVDVFDLFSEPGKGTRVEITKWC